jgi:NADP-dependent 3-hydroxy acid dehydrogenase YdfG
MVALNVTGAAHLMRRAAERMIPNQAGDIVALSSVAGLNISPFSAFYGSTKFALGAIAEGLRREICRHRVRVTVIRPAIVLSEFQAVAGYNEENFGASVKRYGELLAPDDVARAITFIVGEPPHVHINELTIRPVGQDYP